MYAIERRERIREFVRDAGRVKVIDLADYFDVAAETIRRDLAWLEEQSEVLRVHGGAIQVSGQSSWENSFVERLELHHDAKQSIAQTAYRLIPHDFRGSILVDSGTTTLAFAEILLAERNTRKYAFTAITNSLDVAYILNKIPFIELHFIGGMVRKITSSCVGGQALSSVLGMKVDIGILGTNGVSANFGLSTPNEEEAAVKAAMIRSARNVIVLADSYKIGYEALYQFAPLESIDRLISDIQPDVQLREALDAACVEVSIA